MRLNHLKGPPLLSPPTQDDRGGWWVITDADRGAVRESLEYFRQRPGTPEFLQLLSLGKKLNLGLATTEDDVRNGEYQLSKARNSHAAKDIAQVLDYMRDISPQAMSPEDETLIRGCLSDPAPIIGERTPKFVVRYYAKEIGLATEPTETERNMMIQMLETARKEKRGNEIAALLECMKAFGMPSEPTDEDARMMKDTMEKYRKESQGISGLGILIISYNAGQILRGNRQTDRLRPLPPLKKF